MHRLLGKLYYQIHVYTTFPTYYINVSLPCLHINALFYIYSMISIPKSRRKSTSSADNDHTLPNVSSALSTAPLPSPQIETMVQTCMARMLPTIEDTFRQYMDDFYRQPWPDIRSGNSEQTSSPPSGPIPSHTASSKAGSTPAASQELPASPALFQENTTGTKSLLSLTKPTSTCVSLTYGVDDKTKQKEQEAHRP